MKVSAVCALVFAASAQYALAQSSEVPTAASAATGVETDAPSTDMALPTAEPKTNAEIDSCINKQLGALKCKAGDFQCFCFGGGLSEEKAAEDPSVLECVEKLKPEDQITLLQSLQWGCMEAYKEKGITITDIDQIISEFTTATAASGSAKATATGSEATASATGSADDESDATETAEATSTETDAVDGIASGTEAAASSTETSSASVFKPANVFAVAIGGIASLIFLL